MFGEVPMADRHQGRIPSAIAASLSDQIIPRLRERHGIERTSGEPDQARNEASQPINASERSKASSTKAFSANAVAAFTQALMADGDGAWRRLLDRHTSDGMARETIRDDLLVRSAERLGQLWTEDTVTMVDVTVATSRMQAALDSLPARPANGSGHRMLLTQAVGETHVFSLFMLADMLREHGWSVEVELHPDATRISRRASGQAIDVVGIGIAATRFVPSAITLTRTLRNGPLGRSGIPIVAGGTGVVGSADVLVEGGFTAAIAPGDSIITALETAIAAQSTSSGNVAQFART